MKIDSIFNFLQHSHLLVYNVDSQLFLQNLNNYWNIQRRQLVQEGKLTYWKTSYYYLFDCMYIDASLIEFLKKIINSYLFQTQPFVLIFENSQTIKHKLQNSLRVILEKSPIRFIFLATQLNAIISPLRSRCHCVNDNSLEETYESLFDIDLMTYIYNQIFLQHLQNLPKLYKEIQKISFLMITSSVRLDYFMKNFLTFLSKKPYYTNDQYCLLVSTLANLEHSYVNSYYKLIYYEKALLSIFEIIHTTLYNFYIL